MNGDLERRVDDDVVRYYVGGRLVGVRFLVFGREVDPMELLMERDASDPYVDRNVERWASLPVEGERW